MSYVLACMCCYCSGEGEGKSCGEGREKRTVKIEWNCHWVEHMNSENFVECQSHLDCCKCCISSGHTASKKWSENFSSNSGIQGSNSSL